MRLKTCLLLFVVYLIDISRAQSPCNSVTSGNPTAQNSPAPFYIFINGDSDDNNNGNGNGEKVVNSTQTSPVNGNMLSLF